MDVLGHFLRLSRGVPFKGRGRLSTFWLRSREPGDFRWRAIGPGVSIRCDLGIPYEAMVWLRHEEESDLAALRTLLRAGDRFVDCGANIGLWSLTAALAVGGSGRVHAFEPNAEPRRKLEDAIWRSRLRNLSVYPFAVGAREGHAFLEAPPHHNLSRLIRSPTEQTIPVRVVSLDEVLKGEPVAGAKIDVEGHELDVLSGMRGVIESAAPWVVVEFNTLIDGNTRVGHWKPDAFLRERGYVPYLADAVREGRWNAVVEPQCEFAGYRNLYYVRRKPTGRTSA